MLINERKSLSKSVRYPASIVVAIFLLYFVFFFKTDLTQYRTIQQIWNLGHVFLFIGLSYLFLKNRWHNFTMSVYIQFLLLSIVSVVVGTLIEYIQTMTGRDKSSYDVLLDLVGACIGFIFFSKALSKRSSIEKLGFRITVISFTFLALMPMLKVVIDDLQQTNIFPILVENQSKFEQSRFNLNNVQLELKTEENLLKMSFQQARYATASLEYFNQDWSSYKYLSFSVFNKSLLSSLHIRIHDQLHEHKGFHYNDRFNYRVQLRSGWNKIKISLSQVQEAPFKRMMNMHKIRSLIFFKVNVRQSVDLLFTSIKLER